MGGASRKARSPERWACPADARQRVWDSLYASEEALFRWFQALLRLRLAGERRAGALPAEDPADMRAMKILLHGQACLLRKAAWLLAQSDDSDIEAEYVRSCRRLNVYRKKAGMLMKRYGAQPGGERYVKAIRRFMHYDRQKMKLMRSYGGWGK